MKFAVSSSELLKGLLTVSKAIPSKATEAILEDYLFSLSGDLLEVTASDKEITMKTSIAVDNKEGDGRIAVPARQLNDLLRELPDQPLTIRTISENQFECAWASGESSLPYFNPDDYPECQTTGPDAITVEFPAMTLVDGISRTIYASSDEDNRPVMNSIFFDINPDSTTLVASDLQKLTCYTADDVKAENPCSFILNKRHAAVIKSIIGKVRQGDLRRQDGSVQIRRHSDNLLPCCRQISGLQDHHPAEQLQHPQDQQDIAPEYGKAHFGMFPEGIEPHQVRPYAGLHRDFRPGPGLRDCRTREDKLPV